MSNLIRTQEERLNKAWAMVLRYRLRGWIKQGFMAKCTSCAPNGPHYIVGNYVWVHYFNAAPYGGSWVTDLEPDPNMPHKIAGVFMKPTKLYVKRAEFEEITS